MHIPPYLATVWTKDVEDSRGPLLPRTQFQQSLAPHFAESYKLIGDTVEWEACHSDAVRAASRAGVY